MPKIGEKGVIEPGILARSMEALHVSADVWERANG